MAHARYRPLFIATLFLSICAAAAVGADRDPLVGQFDGDDMSITIKRGNDGYSGTIKMKGKDYPFTAKGGPGGLAGTFEADGGKFEFKAMVAGEVMALTSGKTKHILVKKGAGDEQDGNPDADKPGGDKPNGDQPNVDKAPAPGGEADDRAGAVEKAIGLAKQALLNSQKNGNWEMFPKEQPPERPNAKNEVDVRDIANGSQWGGTTALITYALMAAGEKATEEHVAAAIDFLSKADMTGTYSVAMRAQVWNLMPPAKRKQAFEMIKKDANQLYTNMHKAEDPLNSGGFYHYTPQAGDKNAGRFDAGYDHSASQYGVLGMWACAQAGFEVPQTYWQLVDAAWRRDQDASGGWNYTPLIPVPQATAVRASMTAAGVATLFITQDYLNAGAGMECRGNIINKNIDAGLAWMSKNFDQVLDQKNQWPFYTLYGIERIGVASGRKYFGSVDWYKRGVEYLLAAQQPDGTWNGNPWDTSFALLFLVRGRAPVMMNKLEYAFDAHGDKKKEANWNQRPRDAANAAAWVGKDIERDLNWQVVNLEGSPDDLHDAPILYITGNQLLNLSAEHEAKLRDYVHRGGLILANADCGGGPGTPFSNSFKKMCTTLFPPFEFRDLPANHILYNNRFPLRKTFQVQALSNGVRELAILLPNEDISRLLQGRIVLGHENDYKFLSNVFAYSIDTSGLRTKEQTYIVHADPEVSASSTLAVARLKYNGNWDPEPGGWERMAAVMHNRNKVDLKVETVELGTGGLSKFKTAHLTGTAGFTLNEKQRAELKAFVAAGGTLIIDAAGGSTEFAAAAEKELAALYVDESGQLHAPLPGDSPAYAAMGGEAGAKGVTYRRFATKRLGALKGARLRGITMDKRLAVIVSSEDLSAGMVGQDVDGISGYSPKSATDIMASLLMMCSQQK